MFSATEGYIVRIGENTLGGQTVSVLGAGGRVYYYAHLDAYAPNIATGEHVTTETTSATSVLREMLPARRHIFTSESMRREEP